MKNIERSLRLLGVAAVAVLFGSCRDTAPTITESPLFDVTPGTVNSLDFLEEEVTSTTAVLFFTEVSGGQEPTPQPADYDLRYATPEMSWGSADPVPDGTCKTVIYGNTINQTRYCTVTGLEPNTTYEFQMVSFRGTLGVNAVFGSLSNVIQFTTLEDEENEWPNEPSNSTTLSDNPLNELDYGSWQTAYNTASPPLVHPVNDETRDSVLEWSYPTGYTGGGSPGWQYLTHSAKKEVYAGFWWKPSDPWQDHPSHVNKIAFWQTDTWGSSVDIQMYGNELHVGTQFPSGTVRLTPNVHNIAPSLGDWHRIEWYVKYASTPTGSDGVVTWWMDGVLIGHYTNVESANDDGFIEFQFSPTWGGLDGTKTENDHYRYDDVHLSYK